MDPAAGQGKTRTAREEPQLRDHAFYIAYGLLIAAVLALLHASGVLQFNQTISDEAVHYERSLVVMRILSGEASLDKFAELYNQGIWPPFYPIAVGFFKTILGLGLYGARVLNVLLAACGILLMAVNLPRKVRWAAIPIAAGFFAYSHYYYQIRPENLILFLFGAIVFIITKTGAFTNDDRRVQQSVYGALGVLAALLCLTHAAFFLAAVYFALLALFRPRRRFAFLLSFALVAGPYVLIQNLMHTGFVLFATTAQEGLARNNNPYFDPNLSYADNYDQSWVKLYAEMDRRRSAGDFVRFPRPLLVPESHYEKWLLYENKRRIFSDIARETIDSDRLGYFTRMTNRIGAVLSPEFCRQQDAYACRVSPRWLVEIINIMFIAATIAAIVLLLRAEVVLPWTSFLFLGLGAALFVPTIFVTGLWRQFLILPLILIFGALYRWSARHGDPLSQRTS